MDQPALPAALAAQLDLLGIAASGFVPPPAVRDAARAGLVLRAQHGRGGTAVGVARAEGLAAGRPMPRADMRVMAGWFARFAYLRSKPGWGEAQRPSAGFIAWHLWGGDAGRAWVESCRTDWAD